MVMVNGFKRISKPKYFYLQKTKIRKKKQKNAAQREMRIVLTKGQVVKITLLFVLSLLEILTQLAHFKSIADLTQYSFLKN